MHPVKLLLFLTFPCFAASVMAEIPSGIAAAVAEVDSLSRVTDVKLETLFSPPADRLAEELKLDMASTADTAPAVVEILRQKMCLNPSWQVAAVTLVGSHPEKWPDETHYHRCVNALKATLKDDKDWNYYNGPRRWWSPDMFRTRMAMHILYAKTGRPHGFDSINQKLLTQDPEAWLTWVNSLESPIPSLNHPAPATEKIPDQTQPPGDGPGTTQPPATRSKEPPLKTRPYRIGAILSASLAALIGLWLFLKRKTS